MGVCMPRAHTLLLQASARAGTKAHVRGRAAALRRLQHLETQQEDGDPQSPGLRRRADGRAERVRPTTPARTGKEGKATTERQRVA